MGGLYRSRSNPDENLFSIDLSLAGKLFLRYLIHQYMKTYQHIIFWILVHVSLTLIFGKWFESYLEAFYYVSLLLPVVMATSYFFNYYLVPRFLLTKRFLLFGLYAFYMFVISLTLELLASVTSMLMMIKFRINDTGPLVTDVFLMGIILHFVVLIMAFILLIKHYFTDQGAIVQLKDEKLKMERGFITVRSKRKSMRIEYDRLLYIESMADYIKIHMDDGEAVSSREKISHVERELPDSFIRIHRSFIVNKAQVTSYNREEVLLGEVELPVSRSYRKDALERLK